MARTRHDRGANADRVVGWLDSVTVARSVDEAIAWYQERRIDESLPECFGFADGKVQIRVGTVGGVQLLKWPGAEGPVCRLACVRNFGQILQYGS